MARSHVDDQCFFLQELYIADNEKFADYLVDDCNQMPFMLINLKEKIGL